MGKVNMNTKRITEQAFNDFKNIILHAQTTCSQDMLGHLTPLT